MSDQTIISEKQQFTMESEKKQLHNTDLESQISDHTPPPARPTFLLLWLLFVLGTVGTIVSSNWNKPGSPIHATNIQLKSTSTATVSSTTLPTSAPTSTCSHLTLRREWRTMKPAEQANYQNALRCLMELPSKNGSGSRLGDFLSAYRSSGWHATQTSEYLPWNRWFLHTFETALRRECAYTGDMAYLDWTQAIPNTSESKDASPVQDQSQSAMRDASHHLDAALVSEILSAADYTAFARGLETRIQDLAPFDFSNPELPQDPLFLHQAQVDRLWWMWKEHHPSSEMPVEDEQVRIRGFASSVAVFDVQTTENDELCYRYV